MTLYDLQRRNNPYFAFFSPNSIVFQADYITPVEDRLMVCLLNARIRTNVTKHRLKAPMNRPYLLSKN